MSTPEVFLPFDENKVSSENPPQWDLYQVVSFIHQKFEANRDALVKAAESKSDEGEIFLLEFKVRLEKILQNSADNKNLAYRDLTRAKKYIREEFAVIGWRYN